MGERYRNYDKLSSHFLTSIICILHLRWSVYMENLRPPQLQRTAHFGFVERNRAANSFAQTKIVTCIRNHAVAAFHESGCLHPVCPTHQRYAKLCVVKDKMKQSYGRPFFVCSERENPCEFWKWGDIFESPRPLCFHGLVCCERKVKKDGPNQNRLFYCCPKVDACNFFAWKQQQPRVVNTGIVLFSNPPQYRYKIEETGETFNSTKTNAREALEEHKFLKSVNALTTLVAMCC